MNSSASKAPNRRASQASLSVLTARLEASAASFHPLKPATSTGRSSAGFRSSLTYLLAMGRAYHAPSLARRG